jgi:hypothetical protein
MPPIPTDAADIPVAAVQIGGVCEVRDRQLRDSLAYETESVSGGW